MEFEPRVTDGTAITPKIRSRGRIDFDRVSFGYPGTEHRVLEQVSFSAAPGRVLAVVGPSGTGKSTLSRLLLRFYDPDEGRILLDGVDIREAPLQALRHNVTLLQQENLLFPGSVRDNIGYGKRGATDQEIIAAARAADAHDFICALPQGTTRASGAARPPAVRRPAAADRDRPRDRARRPGAGHRRADDRP